MSLRYIANGDNISAPGASYRVPKSTFCTFFPEVSAAIYNALEELIQVGFHCLKDRARCRWVGASSDDEFGPWNLRVFDCDAIRRFGIRCGDGTRIEAIS